MIYSCTIKRNVSSNIDFQRDAENRKTFCFTDVIQSKYLLFSICGEDILKWVYFVDFGMEVECQVICLIITLPFDPNIKSDFTKLQKKIIL